MENDFMAAVASWAPILFMVLIFYFLLYRPQQKARKERDEMLSSLKIGTKIITAGGIYGTITALDDTTVTIKIADNVEITLTRNAIGTIAPEKKVVADDED